MINLNTPSDILMKELSEDREKAVFWLKKHYHGEKGYEKMRENLLLKCKNTRQNQSSDTVEYISRNGNRWIAFEYAIYYPKAGSSNYMPYAFCYYETYASIGAFIPGFSTDKYQPQMNSCIIYTSHFFERFCERLGIKFRSREMVKRFVECVPHQMMAFENPDENGQMKLNVRLPGSVGRGFRRKGELNVFEVRTFLTDKHLSNKQLRETDPVRKIGDAIKFEPEDMKMMRLINSGNPIRAMYDDIKQYKDLGLDTRYMEASVEISGAITFVLLEMKVATPGNYSFWKKHGEINRQQLVDFTVRYVDKPEGFSFFEEFVKLGVDCAKRSGIKNFAKEEFVYLTLTKLYKWETAKARQTAVSFCNIN